MSKSLIFSTVSAITIFIIFIAVYMIRDHKNIGKTTFNDMVDERGEVLNFIDEDAGTYFYQMKINGEIWKVKSNRELAIGEHYTILEQDQDKMILTV